MADEKNNAHDNAIGFALLGIVLAALLWILWYYFEYEIKHGVRMVRWGELWVASQIVDSDYMVAWNGNEYALDQYVQSSKTIQKEKLDGPTMSFISTIALDIYRWPITVLLVLMGGWALFFGPGTQFRRKFTISKLIEVQAKNFPVLSPFIKFNPSNIPPRAPGMPVPAELPYFAEALGPEEWLAYNQIPVSEEGVLDETALMQAFYKQLGPRWQGSAKLEPYKQILLAVCCLKASRKRTQADDMLGRIAKCWSPGKGLRLSGDKKLLSEARRILKTRDLAASTIAKCNQHAFQNTAMIRALQHARDEGGVMAPAQFLWLRAYDRVLWYPLNNLGRQAFHTEAMGAMSHYKAEKRVQRPIPRPKLEDAITSITEYMDGGKARPIPQLDYSNSKKRGIKKAKGQKK